MKTTTLDKHITKYCKKFGIRKAISSTEFAYIPNNELVTYTMYMYDADLQFIELVNEKYSVDIRPWYFIFCLLHEIGHHITFDDLTQEDLLNDQILRQIIIPNIEDTEKCGRAYINLIAEDLATSWAIDYIDTHAKECWELQNKWLKLMAHYHKKEGK